MSESCFFPEKRGERLAGPVRPSVRPSARPRPPSGASRAQGDGGAAPTAAAGFPSPPKPVPCEFACQETASPAETRNTCRALLLKEPPDKPRLRPKPMADLLPLARFLLFNLPPPQPVLSRFLRVRSDSRCS